MLSKLKYRLSSWYDKNMGIKWNISSLWGKISHPFTRTWHWLIKSIQYSVFLWNDHDWEEIFILRLLKYKIERTRKTIIKNDLVVSAPLQEMEMLHVESLINRYLKNDFCREEFKAHYKKWGRSILTLDGFSASKVETKEDKEQERKEFMVILDKQNAEQQKCWDDIFDYMKKYMQGWWD